MALTEIPGSPPLERWFPFVAQREHCVWLDGKSDTEFSTWSILAWDPVEFREGPKQDLLGWLDEVSEMSHNDSIKVPFCGGLIGQFDYAAEVDSYPSIERLSLRGWLGLYDRALVENLSTGQVFAVIGDWIENSDALLSDWISDLEHVLSGNRSECTLQTGEIASDIPAGKYKEGVHQIREWIASGDIYQANLSHRFSCEIRTGRASDLFLELRAKNPSPYSAFLDIGHKKILSASPELFLACDGAGNVQTRPIKGTRPRSSDPEEDKVLVESLVQDAKEQAELLMIVDMERNDLGRVCLPGTVTAIRDFSVESFSSVHHLVGDVRGTLAEGVGWSELFSATFPGGSITGAPKKRAMEIIRAIEVSPRAAFCGAIGYVSAGGAGKWSIGIRTMEWANGRVEFGLGSGIVWDSDPRAEYRETLFKGKRLFEVLGWPDLMEELVHG